MRYARAVIFALAVGRSCNWLYPVHNGTVSGTHLQVPCIHLEKFIDEAIIFCMSLDMVLKMECVLPWITTSFSFNSVETRRTGGQRHTEDDKVKKARKRLVAANRNKRPKSIY